MPKNGYNDNMQKGDDFLTTLISGSMLIVFVSTLAILFMNWIFS